MSERKKVYFAGSIRGGRADADLYREMIEYIKETADVLTEHVGKKDVFELEKDVTDFDIYEQDTAWIRACDFLIAESPLRGSRGSFSYTGKDSCRRTVLRSASQLSGGLKPATETSAIMFYLLPVKSKIFPHWEKREPLTS